MPLDFPSRYESVQYPFGFYVLNYSSRMLTAIDGRSGNTVDLQVVPLYSEDTATLKSLICEIETRDKLKHRSLLPWLHLFAYKGEENPPSLCFTFPAAPLTLLDMIGLFPVCPWPLTHDKVAWIGYQLLSVLHFLHCCGQVLLHLPLRNIHVSTDGRYDVKLQDFSWKYPSTGESVSADDIRQCLRFSYKWNGFSVLAPEVLAFGCMVNKSADVWNLGCVLAMLLNRASLSEDYPKPVLCCPGSESLQACGLFLGPPPDDFLSQIPQGKRKYFSETHSRKSIDAFLLPEVQGIEAGPIHPSCTTRNACDMLKKLLDYPSQRLSTHDAMTHPYFAPYFNSDDLVLNKHNAIDIPANRRQLNKLNIYECKVRLHRSLAMYELQHPLEVYSLQEMCLRTIEGAYSVQDLKKMTFPKSLINAIVDRAESFVKS